MDSNKQALNPAVAEQTRGQSYSQRETELIRELVTARIEQKVPLEFEDFSDYEVPPRTNFSMLNKPALTLKYGMMKYNMACIRLFEGIKYILPMVSNKKKRVAVVCCREEEASSVDWARINKDGDWVNKEIRSEEYVEKIYALMGWDRTCRYKVLGRIANSERGLTLLFDLSDAIMFSALPDEYVDKRTGEVKKRQIKYYPDEYKERFGRSYSDYKATQMSFFESIEAYETRTYSDAARLALPEPSNDGGDYYGR